MPLVLDFISEVLSRHPPTAAEGANVKVGDLVVGIMLHENDPGFNKLGLIVAVQPRRGSAAPPAPAALQVAWAGDTRPPLFYSHLHIDIVSES